MAVGLVVLRHANVPGFGGGFVGVDVFFVLSGFLITGLLLAEAQRRGRISFIDFYVRRARRILPAAALTLVATDIAALMLLNFVRAQDAVVDSIYAAGFAANFHFAAQETDYFAQAKPPSPVLHYWTLSVEEQFYLVWPALVALALFGVVSVARRQRRLLVVVGAVGAASLAWSVYQTSALPPAAYFSPFTRAWELALGALLAIAGLRPPARAAGVLAWAGLLAIAVSAFAYSESTPFPGYAALLPTGGAVLVIWSGTRIHRSIACSRLSRFASSATVHTRSACGIGPCSSSPRSMRGMSSQRRRGLHSSPSRVVYPSSRTRLLRTLCIVHIGASPHCGRRRCGDARCCRDCDRLLVGNRRGHYARWSRSTS